MTVEAATSISLAYAFLPAPNPIRASATSGNPNSVDLQVIVSNPTLSAVTLGKVIIEIPTGEDTSRSISTQPSLPAPVYDTTIPWTITSSGSTITLAPKLGPTGQVLGPIIFTLPGIHVNHVPGEVPATITEFPPSSAQKGVVDTSHSLWKLPSDFPVTSFTATPPTLGDLDMPVTLTWACTDDGKQDVYRVYSDTWQAVDCIHDGKCLTWQDGQAGVQTPALSQTTVFSLDVVTVDGAGNRSISWTLQTTVFLAVPSVSELSHLNQYFSSRAVSLHWLAYDASHCSVTVNGVAVVDKAPVDTYQQGYPLTLPGNHRTYQVSVLAHAATGQAYATHTFPDVKIGPRLTIPAGPSPSAVALTPDGSLALVLNPSAHQMTVVDVAARQPEPQPVALPRSPWSVAVTPDGTLALVPAPLADMLIVNVPARQAEARDYGVGFSPVRIAITPDGKLAFAADPQGPSTGPDPLAGGVWIFDIAARSLDVHHPIRDVPAPYAIAITPDGTLALVTNLKVHSVTVVDVAQRTAEPKTIPVGNAPQGIAITPDGKLALVVNSQDGSLTVIDIPSRTAEPMTISVGSGPDTVAITPNGRMALIGNVKDNSVTVVDIAARAAIGTVPVSSLPARGGQSLVVLPDGSGALVVNPSGNSLSLI